MSKVYEKLLYCQTNTYMETKVADNLYGFTKGTQCLTLLDSNAGEMEINTLQEGFLQIVTSDLSKATDY